MQDVRVRVNTLPNVFGELLRRWAFTDVDSWTRFYTTDAIPTLRAGFSSQTPADGWDAQFAHTNGIVVRWRRNRLNPAIAFTFDGTTLINSNSGDSDYGWDFA
jgi:hypothetical protein